MEEYATRTRDRDGSPVGQAGEFVLPSRKAALATCLRGLHKGPVLITGEPGVGKTWLAGRLTRERREPARWITVDLTPSLDDEGLYRAIGRGLGLSGNRIDSIAVAEALQDDFADNRRWGLLLDEVHLASDDLLEEIRLLGNRLGRPDGVMALVLVGQSGFIRRLSMRPCAALASRLAASVHLTAIDADEAGVLIDHLAPGCALDNATLERCHRDAFGNPRRLLTLAGDEAAPVERGVGYAGVGRLGMSHRNDSFEASPATETEGPRPLIVPPPVTTQAEIQAPAGRRFVTRSESVDPPFEPFLVRTPFGLERPPLASDDGMIEVGWDPAQELEDIASDDALGVHDEDERHDRGAERVSSDSESPSFDSMSPGEKTEQLADHYAALQAWEEWSRNQGRSAETSVPLTVREGREAAANACQVENDRLQCPAAHGTAHVPIEVTEHARPKVWADEQHAHSPFGQLFSTARLPKESED